MVGDEWEVSLIPGNSNSSAGPMGGDDIYLMGTARPPSQQIEILYIPQDSPIVGW